MTGRARSGRQLNRRERMALILERDGAECELVECPMDPSPHAFRFEADARGELRWRSDFHQRPRLPGHDVDVCFGGRIALTRIPLRLRP